MRLEILALITLGIMCALALGAHLHYFVRVTNHIKRTTKRSFLRKDLKEALSIPQGSNFNIIMLLSWNLFMVALAFLLFLTPEVFSAWNYFKYPDVASSSYGLAAFGTAIVCVPGLMISLFVPQAYRYYLIGMELKELNKLTPILLISSILSSTYLATIYPQIDLTIWIVGYGFLLVSLALLIAPILIGYIEELRT